MTEPLLTPVLDDDGAPFWGYAAQGELRIQACADCGELRFPPRPCCPHCRSFGSEWRRMSGLGRVWSYVVPHPPLLPAYAALAPYNAIVVELAEARTSAWSATWSRRRAPCSAPSPDRIRIGARVRVVFGGEGLPQWVLDGRS
ncbi:zinc ribbon domain-containing protein [Streptomyces mirabilis]|nr:zinc ribbon domain-containing protein [Streptomyces mirabilis]